MTEQQDGARRWIVPGILGFLFLLAVLSFFGKDENLTPEKTEPVLIRFEIKEFEQAFNSQNLEKVLTFYSDDFIEVYPGQPDEVGLEAVRNRYQHLFSRYELVLADSIEEILVEGDLAAVRVTWIVAHLAPGEGRGRVYSRERALEIWERATGGRWKIKRRYRFPD